jgi:hypothetical protein
MALNDRRCLGYDLSTKTDAARGALLCLGARRYHGRVNGTESPRDGR